jgi:hypothetical protein
MACVAVNAAAQSVLKAAGHLKKVRVKKPTSIYLMLIIAKSGRFCESPKCAACCA